MKNQIREHLREITLEKIAHFKSLEMKRKESVTLDREILAKIQEL